MMVFFGAKNDLDIADIGSAPQNREQTPEIRRLQVNKSHPYSGDAYREGKIMKVLFGAKEDLSESGAGHALEHLGELAGVIGINVNEFHPHMMFVEFDGSRLQRTDIISYMGQFGVHATGLGC